MSYTDIIKSSYSNNITGQIAKIEDAHKVIKNKAVAMGLKNSSGSELKDTSKILDTAWAIDSIVLLAPVNQELAAGGSYTVPPGYYSLGFTITATTLADQTYGTAGEYDILAGKTAYVEGKLITGKMLDKSGNLSTSSIGSYEESGKQYLYFAIPDTGKYTKDSQLKSTIQYFNSLEINLPVTILQNEAGETIVDASQQTFDPGYYSGKINISAIFKDSTNKVININNSVGELSSLKGYLSVPSGYDYFAPNASYEIKVGSVTPVERSVDAATGKVTFSGGIVTTAGWISSNVGLPETYTPALAQFSTNSTSGQVTTTQAGWVTKGMTIGGISEGSAEITGPSLISDSYYMTLTKKAGYITDGTITKDLGKTALSSTAGNSSATGISVITAKDWKVTASKGYNESTLTQNLSVQAADYTADPVTGGIKITKAGWIDVNTYGLLQAGSAIISGPIRNNSNDIITVGSVSIPANSHYIKLTKTAGYINKGDEVINLGTVTISNGESTGTSTSTITKQIWQVTTSKGYNPEPISTVLSVQNAEYALNADSSAIIVSTPGWVDAINITIADQEYAITDQDMLEEDNMFTIATLAGTLMKSLTINTTNIYEKLAAI